jgi:hypothetical protein
MSKADNVMISYRTANRETADELYAALEGAGLCPWMDYKGIEPGAKWREELLKEVRVCDGFIPLLTPDYVESEHCRMELLIARSRGCAILPVMLEECFDQLERYEEAKGLADTFMLLVSRLRVAGLPITHGEAIQRLVGTATTIGREPVKKPVYVSYCNAEAALATRIAERLESDGIPAWVATRDCRVGDNWRQAQARGIMDAALQVVVLDESIHSREVLRTEIILAEAFGLPVLTVLGEKLSKDDEALSRLMRDLRAADLTYRRLTDVQPFRCDEASLVRLAKRVRSCLPPAGP